MQNLSVVNMFYCQAHLHKPVENLILGIHDLPDLLLVCDLGVEIPSVCVIHDYAQTLLVHE